MNAHIFPIAARKPNLSPQDCGFPRDVVKCVKRYRLPLLGRILLAFLFLLVDGRGKIQYNVN